MRAAPGSSASRARATRSRSWGRSPRRWRPASWPSCAASRCRTACRRSTSHAVRAAQARGPRRRPRGRALERPRHRRGRPRGRARRVLPGGRARRGASELRRRAREQPRRPEPQPVRRGPGRLSRQRPPLMPCASSAGTRPCARSAPSAGGACASSAAAHRARSRCSQLSREELAAAHSRRVSLELFPEIGWRDARPTRESGDRAS